MSISYQFCNVKITMCIVKQPLFMYAVIPYHFLFV